MFLSKIVRIRALWKWSVNHHHLSCRIINMCIYFSTTRFWLFYANTLGSEMRFNHPVVVTPERVRLNGSPVQVQESLKINGELITRISTVSDPSLLVPQISVPIVLPPESGEWRHDNHSNALQKAKEQFLGWVMGLLAETRTARNVGRSHSIINNGFNVHVPIL